MPKKQEIEHRLGQIWADNDKREWRNGEPTRFLGIEYMNALQADMREVFKNDEGEWVADTRIRVRAIMRKRIRPTSTGYVLIKDAPTELDASRHSTKESVA